ncbi:hypothetical protein [Fibrella forsythiae]|uniref:Uncharacterized protein n=1 Tax=Fibrella forsythiae TaxID=2817061 RepID=A0ABS3JKA4_9BACT|nr:hypothetical protein [Fibrella forsythiae]MBO0950441.1 hypothetical protein [Fibrella forsythiae]
MLHRLILCFATLCLLHKASAQSNTGPAGDAIYLANGTRYKNAQLVEITAERVKFTVKHGDALTNHNYGRDVVLMAFTQEGNFLIVDEVSTNAVQADQQLKDFLMAPARTSPTDMMIRRVPLEVLRGTISYESEEVINYQPVNGGAASINKNELLMIFYSDGKHQILTDFVEIAPILADLRPQLTASAPATAVTTAPAVPVTPSPATTEPAPAPTRQTKTAPTRPTRPSPTPAAEAQASKPAPASPTGKLSLNEADYVTYRAKAMQRVDEFVSYINIITDKSLSGDDKDRAIEQAIKLFIPDATIEVTSASKPGTARKMGVRTYLTRLKLLPYSYTKVSWSEVQYVKELTQEADGNYYGTITGQQTFTGYGKSDAVTYSDVTQKNVRVKLQPAQKLINEQVETNWQVLLGNVGVGSSQ